MTRLHYDTIEIPEGTKLNKQQYHYDRAEALLERAEDEIILYEKDADVENLEFAQVLITKAHAHATLATIINKEPME